MTNLRQVHGHILRHQAMTEDHVQYKYIVNPTRVFSKSTGMAIMPMLAAEALLRGKKFH